MAKCGEQLGKIAETIQNYFDGMHFADVSRLRKAFHPQANLSGYLRGQFLYISCDDWFGMIEQGPNPNESGEKQDMFIVSASVDESMATVVVSNLFLGTRFTDHLCLLRVDDNWVIVNKSFWGVEESA